MTDVTEHVRYVVLRHEGVAERHFDFMFETVPGGPLLTWRSLTWPIERETPLVRLGEHRRDYLDYEGPVSNDRGRVARVAGGTCDVEWVSRHDCTIRLDTGALIRLQLLDDDHWVASPPPTAT